MDRALYVGMTGAMQTLQAQTVNSHNLANASTTGFKAALVAAQAVDVRGDVQLDNLGRLLTASGEAVMGEGGPISVPPASSLSIASDGTISILPQGQAEKDRRVLNLVRQMDAEGFGTCTNHGECEAACPKGITLDNIARMNRDFIKASLTYRPESGGGGA